MQLLVTVNPIWHGLLFNFQLSGGGMGDDDARPHNNFFVYALMIDLLENNIWEKVHFQSPFQCQRKEIDKHP